VLPAHIGAERVAEIILYPAAARAMQHGDRTRAMEKELHSLEVELELVVAEKGTQVGPAFFCSRYRPSVRRHDRAAGWFDAHRAADGVVILGRANRAEALLGFQAGHG
jgi:hypothetical protein